MLRCQQESSWKEKEQLEGFDPAVMCPCSLQPKRTHPWLQPWAAQGFWAVGCVTDTGWKKKSGGMNCYSLDV